MHSDERYDNYSCTMEYKSSVWSCIPQVECYEANIIWDITYTFSDDYLQIYMYIENNDLICSSDTCVCPSYMSLSLYCKSFSPPQYLHIYTVCRKYYTAVFNML